MIARNASRLRTWTFIALGAGLALVVALAACGPVEPTGEGLVSVRVTVEGPGSVWSTYRGGEPCSDDCTWSLREGTTSLEAWPTGDNAFVEWGGVCEPFPMTCSRAFSDGDEITATFAANALRLDLTGDGEGRFEIRGGDVSEDCTTDCAFAVPGIAFAITYVGDATRTELSEAWGGACEASPFDDYCQLTVSGQADVSKTWRHPPVAEADTYATLIDETLSVDADAGVLANDDDSEGDTLSAAIVTTSSNGALTLRTDGGFDYVPEDGFDGTDDFRYRVVDEFGNEDEAVVTITVDNALLSLTKTGTFNDDITADGFAEVGETIDYTFNITNDGNVTLTNITLTDPLVTLTGSTITSLAPNTSDTTTYTGTYVITQTDIDTGSFENTATADSDQTPPTNDSDTVDLPQNPVLGLTKTGVFQDENDDGFADVDETIVYTFNITNEGNVTLDNITLTDPLVTLTGTTITSLAPGSNDDTTYSGTYAITQADIDTGSVTNTATADSDQTPPTNDKTTTPLPQNPVLTLSKSGLFQDENGDTFADVDETIVYTFTITNDGNVTLTNITLTDTLVTPTGGPITTLAPSTSDDTTYKATYTITQADIDTGSVTNTATADSDQTPPTNDETIVTLDAP